MTDRAIDATALGVLAATPAIVSSLFAAAAADAATEPRDDGWSAKDVLAHLVDCESGVLAERVRRMIDEERPFIRSIDAPARIADGGYAQRGVASLLAELEQQRGAHIAWLRSLDTAQLQRAGDHDEAGEITVSDIIHQWAYHDLMHLKQIASILQTGLAGRMGNTRRFYDV